MRVSGLGSFGRFLAFWWVIVSERASQETSQEVIGGRRRARNKVHWGSLHGSCGDPKGKTWKAMIADR